MTIKVIDNPNTPSSIMMNNLKTLSEQRDKYSKYDTNVPNFNSEEDNTVEPFMTFDKFMFDKLLIIIIIGLLAIFIIKGMDIL